MSNDGFFDRARIFLWGPFARFLYGRRKKFRKNKRYPIEWYTPRQLLFLDMENYEPDGDDFKLDKDFLKSLGDTRDKIADRVHRLMFLVYAAIGVVVSRYFGVELHIPVAGIQAVDFVYAKELLLIFSTIVSTYISILQNNIYTIESAMNFIIEKKIPIELSTIYRSMYLYSNNFMQHIPRNLPYINMPKWTYRLKIIPVVNILIATIGGLGLYYALLFSIVSDIWVNPDVDFWSRGAVIFICLGNVNALIYVFATQLSMPHRNWIKLEKMDVLKENWPNQFEKEFGNEYQDDFEDEKWMVDRGYIKRPVIFVPPPGT